jgi:hypothetical protein
LITHPILRIWPRPTSTCFMDWKKLKNRHFFRRKLHWFRAELIGGKTFQIFFELLADIRATDLKEYWASWRECWINPEFGLCSLFPFWMG